MFEAFKLCFLQSKRPGRPGQLGLAPVRHLSLERAARSRRPFQPWKGEPTMKISLCSLFAGVLLLAAAAAFAAPPPQPAFLASLSAGQDEAQAPIVSTPAASARAEDTCNPPIYS